MSAPVSVNAQADTKISDSCNCVSRCCIRRPKKRRHKHTEKTEKKVEKVVSPMFEKVHESS